MDGPLGAVLLAHLERKPFQVVKFLLDFDFWMPHQNLNLEWILVPKGRLSTSIGHQDSTSHAYVPLAAEGLKK